MTRNSPRRIQRLRTVLLDLDVDSAEPLPETDVSEGAKGMEALVGWLAVRSARRGCGR